MAKITARYTGDGEHFIVGVPARDLTADEYDALDADQKRLVRSSDLYDVTSGDAPRSPSAKADATKGGGS